MSRDSLDVSAEKGLLWVSRWFQVVLVIAGMLTGALGYWGIMPLFLHMRTPWDLLITFGVLAAICGALLLARKHHRYSIPFAIGALIGGAVATAFFMYLFAAFAEGFGATF